MIIFYDTFYGSSEGNRLFKNLFKLSVQTNKKLSLFIFDFLLFTHAHASPPPTKEYVDGKNHLPKIIKKEFSTLWQ